MSLLPNTYASFTLSQLYGQVITQKTKKKKKVLHFALLDANISQPTWSRIMAGKSLISFDSMSRLCQCLSLDFLSVLEEIMALSQKLTDNGYFSAMPSVHGNKGQGVDKSSSNVPKVVKKDILQFFIEQIEKP